MSEDSLMTIYGDDGPCDLYFRGRLVASGSHAAMRAASRLLTGRCETKPSPLELTGYWVREPDETGDLYPRAPKALLDAATTFSASVKAQLEAMWARREPVDTVAPLHNDAEPGQ